MHYYQLATALCYAIFETEILVLKYIEIMSYVFSFYSIYIVPDPYEYLQL
jgi:hypothetical protein